MKSAIDFNIDNCLQVDLDHEQAQSEHIKKCVDYHASCNYKSFIFFVAYRVYQTALSIFHKSDWQIAKKETIELMKTKPKTWVAFQQVKSDEAWNFLADNFLQRAVNLYHYCSSHDFNKITIDFFCDDFRGLAVDYWTRYQQNTENAKPVFNVFKLDDKGRIAAVLING